jgi:hypothetical protein
MLDGHEAQIRAWLDAEPGLSARAVLTRLTEAVPDQFNDARLRTVQRAVKAWRGQMARKLILEGLETLIGSAATPGPRQT